MLAKLRLLHIGRFFDLLSFVLLHGLPQFFLLSCYRFGDLCCLVALENVTEDVTEEETFRRQRLSEVELSVTLCRDQVASMVCTDLIDRHSYVIDRVGWPAVRVSTDRQSD